MMIVPVSRLSASEIALLGNNIAPPIKSPRRRRPRTSWVAAAGNRSIKVVAQRIDAPQRRAAVAS